MQQKKEPGIENYRSDECGGTEMLLSKRESADCTDILATMSLRHIFIPITTIVQIDKNRSPKPQRRRSCSIYHIASQVVKLVDKDVGSKATSIVEVASTG